MHHGYGYGRGRDDMDRGPDRDQGSDRRDDRGYNGDRDYDRREGRGGGWREGRTQRVASGFYTSQAWEWQR